MEGGDCLKGGLFFYCDQSPPGNELINGSSENSISDIPVEDFLLCSMSNSKDKFILQMVEQELISFVNSNNKIMKFPDMSSYNRMLVHKLAAYFTLEHVVDLTGNSVIVSKNDNSKIPEIQLQDLFEESLKNPRLSQPVYKSILKRQNVEKENLEEKLEMQEPILKSFKEREEEYQSARDRIFKDMENIPDELHEITDKLKEDLNALSPNDLKLFIDSYQENDDTIQHKNIDYINKTLQSIHLHDNLQEVEDPPTGIKLSQEIEEKNIKKDEILDIVVCSVEEDVQSLNNIFNQSIVDPPPNYSDNNNVTLKNVKKLPIGSYVKTNVNYKSGSNKLLNQVFSPYSRNVTINNNYHPPPTIPPLSHSFMLLPQQQQPVPKKVSAEIQPLLLNNQHQHNFKMNDYPPPRICNKMQQSYILAPPPPPNFNNFSPSRMIVPPIFPTLNSPQSRIIVPPPPFPYAINNNSATNHNMVMRHLHNNVMFPPPFNFTNSPPQQQSSSSKRPSLSLLGPGPCVNNNNNSNNRFPQLYLQQQPPPSPNSILLQINNFSRTTNSNKSLKNNNTKRLSMPTCTINQSNLPPQHLTKMTHLSLKQNDDSFKRSLINMNNFIDFNQRKNHKMNVTATKSLDKKKPSKNKKLTSTGSKTHSLNSIDNNNKVIPLPTIPFKIAKKLQS